MKKVRAAIESGDQNLLFGTVVHRFGLPDSSGWVEDSLTLLHEAAWYGLVDSVQQLIKAGGKKLLLVYSTYGRSALHYASLSDRVEEARSCSTLLTVMVSRRFTMLLARAVWSLCGSSLRWEEWS